MNFNWHLIQNYLDHFLVAKRKGHGVHSPFAYQLCEEVFYNTHISYDFFGLNKIRKQLLHDNTILEIEDFGAGSKAFNTTKRKVSEIAARGISTQKQSEIYYRLINFLRCEHIVELGTSLGLNTLYLASPNKNNQVITLEGSVNIYMYAKNLALKTKTDNIKFINSKFDEALPKILDDIKTIDCFYVDGNHTYQATKNYFNLAFAKKNKDSVFIFDDIYWSKDMTSAWKEIKQHREVTLSVDAFYFGMIFFKGEIKERIDLKIYI